jgi:hypothetical protein
MIQREYVCAECGLATDASRGQHSICVCLDSGGDLRTLAVDPGDKHVGTTLGLIDGGDPNGVRALQSWTFSQPVFISVLEDMLAAGTIDLIVCEDFVLYPWKAREQGYGQFATVKLIGVIQYLAQKYGIPVVLQGANIKKMAIAVGRGRHFPAIRLRSGREDFPGKNQHERDSVAHLVWYGYRNPNSPINLGMQDT